MSSKDHPDLIGIPLISGISYPEKLTYVCFLTI